MMSDALCTNTKCRGPERFTQAKKNGKKGSPAPLHVRVCVPTVERPPQAHGSRRFYTTTCSPFPHHLTANLPHIDLRSSTGSALRKQRTVEQQPKKAQGAFGGVCQDPYTASSSHNACTHLTLTPPRPYLATSIPTPAWFRPRPPPQIFTSTTLGTSDTPWSRDRAVH